jgi:hypothetical protein
MKDKAPSPTSFIEAKLARTEAQIQNLQIRLVETLQNKQRLLLQLGRPLTPHRVLVSETGIQKLPEYDSNYEPIQTPRQETFWDSWGNDIRKNPVGAAPGELSPIQQCRPETPCEHCIPTRSPKVNGTMAERVRQATMQSDAKQLSGPPYEQLIQ